MKRLGRPLDPGGNACFGPRRDTWPGGSQRAPVVEASASVVTSMIPQAPCRLQVKSNEEGGMTKKEWEALLGRLEINTRIGQLKSAHSEDLDAFENQFQVKLPLSYRAYCETFGPG